MNSCFMKRGLSLLLCLLLTVSCSFAALAEGIASPSIPGIDIPGDDPNHPTDEPCTHSSTTVNTVLVDSKYTEIEGDNSRHNYTEYFKDVTACLLCGEELSVTDPYPGETYVYSHNYKDNVCTQCGYVNSCEHANIYEWYYWYNGVVYEEIENNNAKHMCSGLKVINTQCDDCGVVINKTDPVESTELEWHYYTDGACEYCGHVNTCEHENADQWDEWDWETRKIEEIKNDNLYHKVSGTQHHVIMCQECGYFNNDESFDAVQNENHSYVDGICQKCGHVNTCEHTKTEQWTQWDWDTVKIEEIKGDNLYHKMSGNQYLVIRCKDCKTYEYGETYEATDKTGHYYEDGICQECGHVNTCEHTNTQQWSQWDWDTVKCEEIKDDNGYHKASGQMQFCTWCDDCANYVSFGEPFDATQNETHIYLDGVCSDCGHINTCKHENNLSHWYDWEWETVNYTEVSDNNAYHIMSGKQHSVTYCDDCHTFLEEGESFDSTDVSSHNYRNGVCDDCDHVNTCEHSSIDSDEYFDWNTVKYTEIEGDNVYHLATGKVYTKERCSDCFTTLKRSEYHDGSVKYMHSYKNGVCTECGHKNTCGHLYTLTDEWFDSTSTYKESASNDRTHTVSGSLITRTYCEACRMTLEEKVTPNQTLEEKHSYGNGLCIFCGHVNTCKHENVTEETYRTNSKYSDPIPEGHYTEYDLVKYTYCDNCGVECAERVVLETGLKSFDSHIAYGGGEKCTQCGYEFNCKHENTKEEIVWIDNGALTIKPYDNSNHMCKGYNKTCLVCMDCDAVVHFVEYSEDIEEGLEPHILINGKCAYCGYKPTAANTPVVAEEPIVLPAIEPMPVVETILSIAEEAQDDGVVVTVEIVGIEEVVTEQEMKVLNTLPATEQLMVTLAAIGFDQEVKAVVASLGITLSSDAENLMNTISVRQSEMTAEEKAELVEKLTKLFPTVEVEVDGVIYQYSVIELKIVVDGKERTEKYGFRLDENDEWELIRL